MKSKILLILLIIVVLSMSLMSCAFQYGTPDSLDMANSSVGQRIVIGLEVALLGIGVVFVVLALLIGFILLLKYGFKASDVVKAKFAKKQPKVEEVKAAPVIEGLENEDEELAAVITAAIMAYYDNTNVKTEYKSNLTFKVRKITEIK